MDTQMQLGYSKDHIRVLYNSVSKLKDIAERMVMRATSYACDMVQFGQELRYVVMIQGFSGEPCTSIMIKRMQVTFKI